jgi:uncharacterized protein YdcH (DUF465 family)
VGTRFVHVGISCIYDNYALFYRAKKIFEDIAQLKGNFQRIKSLEDKVEQLEKTITSLVDQKSSR